MIADAVEPLWRLRALRRDRAESALARAARHARERADELAAERARLEEHERSRGAAEERLFEAFRSSAGDPDALELYRARMSDLLAGRNRLRERIVEAERELQAASESAAAARSTYEATCRTVEKLAVVREHVHRERAMEVERREEATLEEQAGVLFVVAGNGSQ